MKGSVLWWFWLSLSREGGMSDGSWWLGVFWVGVEEDRIRNKGDEEINEVKVKFLLTSLKSQERKKKTEENKN